MALPSFFKRKPKTAAKEPARDPLGDDSGPVQAARARARRRLIGAVVLLAIGVVGFPMIFETRPRPLPENIPIELPRRDGAPARVAAAPRLTPSVTELPPAEPVSVASGADAPRPEGARPEAARPDASSPDLPRPETPRALPSAEPKAIDIPMSAMKPASPADGKVEAKTDSKPDAKPANKPDTKPGAKADTKPKADIPAEAKAASKPAGGKPEPARAAKPEADKPKAAADTRHAASGTVTTEAKAGRFVVQVGAYTDNATLQDVRAKVERLGLKTYTQSVETPAGKRTRVRVGPFESKAEADSASSRLKGAGLPGNVLSL